MYGTTNPKAGIEIRSYIPKPGIRNRRARRARRPVHEQEVVVTLVLPSTHDSDTVWALLNQLAYKLPPESAAREAVLLGLRTAATKRAPLLKVIAARAAVDCGVLSGAPEDIFANEGISKSARVLQAIVATVRAGVCACGRLEVWSPSACPECAALGSARSEHIACVTPPIWARMLGEKGLADVSHGCGGSWRVVADVPDAWVAHASGSAEEAVGPEAFLRRTEERVPAGHSTSR